MNRYVVDQPFRGTATFIVLANTAKEALEKVNSYSDNSPDVECVDKDATWIGKAVYARLEAKNVTHD